MRTHNLKTWPQYLARIKSGEKTFELRKNDRDYQVGDMLVLNEYNPGINDFTGYTLLVKVTYIVHGPNFGIQEGYCVMAIKFLKDAP